MTPRCKLCESPLPASSTYCAECVGETRTLLADILAYYVELSGHLGRLRGQVLGMRGGGTEGRPLPGGDALVLLGPGSPGYAEDAETSREGDPPSVAYELRYWEKDWREERKEICMCGNVPSSVKYLYTNSRWASINYPGFAEFYADLKRLRLRLSIATCRHRSPVKANASCFRCGGVLQRQIDARGFEEEHVTCRDCGDTYDAGRYLLALRAAAEQASSYVDSEGDQWETPAVLGHRLGRSVNSLAAWRRDKRVRAQVRDGGVVFLNVQDVESEHEARSTRET